MPFVVQKRKELNLDETHPALVLFDCFKGQTTEDVQKQLSENNIYSIQIPPNCTDKLQLMDISINKPMKDELRSRFHKWYSNEVMRQMKDVPIEEVKINVHLTSIKGLSASWIISSWQAISSRPTIAINGFQHAGITAAVKAVRE